MVGQAPAAQRYFTPYEVASHNCPNDCWVSCLGHVYDLTGLVLENEGPLAEPVLREAGNDISHWFDTKTGDVKTHVCPSTNIRRPLCPQKGKLSKRCRNVRIKNVLTEQEHTLEVPCEELLSEIRTRYFAMNAHATAYIWKAVLSTESKGMILQELDMNKTLSGNGIVDETEAFEECSLGDDFYLPVLHLYFTDDLTVA